MSYWMLKYNHKYTTQEVEHYKDTGKGLGTRVTSRRSFRHRKVYRLQLD